MKKFFSLLALCGMLLAMQACKKDIPITSTAEPEYSFTSLDSTGGNWKTFVLTSNTQIAVAAPDPTNAAAYQSDLAAMKTALANISSDQKTAVNYWGTNSQIRWNDILDQLCAKYNLPPAPNPQPDTSGNYYGVPANAAPPANPNWTSYPTFPFATPPYASRAYANWSAAMYDAMVTVWHYKYQYNRPAPYKVDNTISPLLPQNNLPSYPSEDAAIAGASDVILRALFPLDSAMIDAKCAELENIRIAAGMNVQSDITAGDALGRAVGAAFKARMKADGMSGAQPSQAKSAHVTDSIRNAAVNNGVTAASGLWLNLESPARPIGINPLYGKVKAWYVSDITTLRCGPPPAQGSDAFNAAVSELKSIQKNLTTDQRNLSLYWNDGPGTYTPQGHWNRTAAVNIVANQMNPLRTARVFAYINTAMQDASISCWESKYHYYLLRPSGADASINTEIGIPNFPSYPSGHASFSWAGATVLTYLFPNNASEFSQLATDATNSRIYGRIHYRFDCDAGQQIGKAAGANAVTAAQKDGAN